MDLIKLATMFRILNFYTHQAHHLTSGPSFLADHSFLAEIYGFADDCYDSLIERHIGTVDRKVNLKEILKDCLDEIENFDDNYFETSLDIISTIVKEINSATGVDADTANLIQGQADKLQVFAYKIKQRL